MIIDTSILPTLDAKVWSDQFRYWLTPPEYITEPYDEYIKQVDGKVFIRRVCRAQKSQWTQVIPQQPNLLDNGWK